MQLSPLQSRLAASAIATVLLMILYLSLFKPQFALAAEIHNPPPIILDESIDASPEGADIWARGSMYQAEFSAFDKSLTGRTPMVTRDTVTVTNNVGTKMNLNAGDTYVFVFDSSQLNSREEDDARLELRGEAETSSGSEADDAGGETKLAKRASGTVYISANTCLQPSSNSTTDALPPQLTLYVSTSTDNTSPGPSADSRKQDVRVFESGAVMYNMTASDDVYVAVAASNSTGDFSGIYNVQVGISVDGWYHSYNESNAEELFWVDSDTSSVLLMTQNLTTDRDHTTEQELMTTRPYVMFAQNVENPSISGLENSFCGLNNNAQIATVRNGATTSQVTTGMTMMGAGGLPKQQFYFSGLNSSSTYVGILAKNVDNSTNTNIVGGGGSVYRTTYFTTKSSYGNCELIFNLTFCDQVAYAVPGNNIKFPTKDALGLFYDSYAESLYEGFNKSMTLIPCDAPNTQQFSLVRNCTTCRHAYKNWLCSVTIPRCEDFTSNSSFLQPRAMNATFPDGATLPADLLAPYTHFNNQLSFLTSRNPLIDSTVKPGPYKEVLPCEELCYDLVQSCPSAMGFTCPRSWLTGFNTSYGTKTGSEDGSITCNYPGSFHFYSAATRSVAVTWGLTSGMALMAFLAAW
ncbi:stretch-activated Ca2+-permeable channel component-domain-containing protein [Coniella lustricola]|uniref:Stretch-activated Ca2+-permeable channel component-domain-containing protein n=1 Tax=Coniella lustricola TaxID=2025994 RepID=A0A2T2ZXS6_9PEZI|nr:stretch-activated Ca2+-permeable channel component-domain-containing protein [Coniella lustricola]